MAIAEGRLNFASKIEVGAVLPTIHADMDDEAHGHRCHIRPPQVGERLASEATALRPKEVAETARIPFEEVPLHHEVGAKGGHRGLDVGSRLPPLRRDQAPFSFEQALRHPVASPSSG